MKQVLINRGKIIVADIPVPKIETGNILVQVHYSCISSGTEISGIKKSGVSIWKQAFRQPNKIKRVLKMISKQGLTQTKFVLKNKINEEKPIGYSAAGVVIEVGEGVIDIKPGDRVACAGAQCSFHAEYICVPRNLTAKIPTCVSLSQACTTTLGAIAMQGIRRCQPTLGECFVVIGLGILGQLTSQLLKANGCKVIGTDLDKERIKLAMELGMDYGIHSENGNEIDQVLSLTHGIGADGVIITAATSSNAVISSSFNMCRKKGRVVLVGDVGLNLNRDDFYYKEIDFYISSSYGPGRYDSNYEEKGIDYPIAYVRWTENRNMAEYLRLIAEERINISALIKDVFSITDASEAYSKITGTSNRALMVLLSYANACEQKNELQRKIVYSSFSSSIDKIRLAIIGAGSYAKNMHLPLLKTLSNLYNLRAVMSRTGHNAYLIAKQYGISYATTDYDEILQDPTIDAVLICTRHNLHYPMLIQALKAGKHVLVEKPMVISQTELDSIQQFYDMLEGDYKPILFTGYNRRFSKIIQTVMNIVSKRINPMVINYRMNAGYIPLDHWVHTMEGGGRNIGEACHIYDLFTFLTNSEVVSVDARSITPKTGFYSHSDNFVTVIKYADGTVANLSYTALGTNEFPKEQFEIYVDGKVIIMCDYKHLSIKGLKMKDINNKIVDKGQKEMLEAFAKDIKSGGEWAIPFWQQIQDMKIAFDIEKQIKLRG